MTLAAADRPAEKSVCFIIDNHSAERGQNLAASLGLPTVNIGHADGRPRSPQADMVIDCDLHRPENILALKRLFAAGFGQGLRVFVVDRGRKNRPACVQAEALGATRIVAREQALKDLLQAQIVPRLGLPGASKAARLAQSPAGASIAAASEALASLFDGVLSDQPIVMESLTAASENILAGINDAGTSNWLSTVRDHHQGTFQHCLLVAGVAGSYVRHVRLGKVPAVSLMNAAMLHDIGKAMVPLSILDKPEALNPAELAVMRGHPAAGYDFLLTQKDLSRVILDAVRHHHEYLDGSGYPDGIAGAEIAPLTRVLTVCDIFAALIELRPYKRTRTPAEAVAILAELVRAGKLDGDVVRNLAQAFDIWVPEDELLVIEKRPYLRA